MKVGAASVRVVQVPINLPKGFDLADEIPAWLDPAKLMEEAKELTLQGSRGRRSTAVVPINPPGGEPVELTDIGNAHRFARQHGEDVRYCTRWKSWMCFDGQRWREDDRGDVGRRRHATARAIYSEAVGALDRDEA